MLVQQAVGQRAHLVSTPRWIKVHMSMIAQKNRNESSKRVIQKFFWKKIFFRPKIFKKPLFLAIFGRKNGKDKNFWSKKIFWSESIQNGPKRILKRKSRFRKIFPIMTWHCHFFKKWGLKSKKMAKTKIFGRKFFLVGIDSEWSKTYFKMKISISKIFSHYNFFLGR